MLMILYFFKECKFFVTRILSPIQIEICEIGLVVDIELDK